MTERRSKKTAVAVLVIFTGLMYFPSPAQVADVAVVAQNFHRWGSVTQFNGLPSDTVRAIAQTPDGVIWLGTDNGLARFDGRRVQTVALPAESTGKVLSLGHSSDGALYIGTERGAFVHRANSILSIKGLEEKSVVSISPPLFVVNKTQIYEAVENSSGDIVAVPVLNEGVSDRAEIAISSVARTSVGTLVGTAGRGTMLVSGDQLSDTLRADRPYFVNAIATDKTGNTWLGGGGGTAGVGLFRLDEQGSTRAFGPPTGDVISLAVDESGGVWAGTNRSGLFHFRSSDHYDHYTFENTAGNLRSNTIHSIFVDHDGVVWIGTDRGVSRFDPASPFHRVLSDEVNGNFVRSIYTSKSGRIFAGTNRGLAEFRDGNWSHVPGFERRTIYAIGEDSNGGLLIGTPTALLDEGSKTLYEGDVRGVAELNGSIYAAIFGVGAIRLEADETPTVFANPAITTMSVFDNSIYVGTAEAGLFKLDGKRAEQIVLSESAWNGAIWKIKNIAPDGLLIAGERGLLSVSAEGTKSLIDGRDIRDAVIDGNDIWAATTDGGLLHVRNDEKFGRISAGIGVEEGLPSDKAFALLKTESGFIIGTSRGVAEYSPGKLEPKLLVTRVVSRRLHGTDELASLIELDFPQNSLLVEVTGLNSRTFPEEFQYAFRLMNRSGEIIENRISNEPQFSPANLRPGEYAIEATAFGRDLIPSEPLTIRFSIGKAPFPWTATALGVLLAIALIALVWAIIERRRIAERNRQLAAARLDLANEAERERRRIARDLHDQTLADLRSLIMKSDRVAPDLRGDIETVSTEIRRICEDLSPSVLENVGLVAALEFLLAHTIENHIFKAVGQFEEHLRFPVTVQLQIYRIVQEALSNIERHADAKEVRMDVSMTDGETFQIVIEDDGNSFEPSDATVKGRGIANIKARASLINARIDWQKIETGGTSFSLSISPADDPSPRKPSLA